MRSTSLIVIKFEKIILHKIKMHEVKFLDGNDYELEIIFQMFSMVFSQHT